MPMNSTAVRIPIDTIHGTAYNIYGIPGYPLEGRLAMFDVLKLDGGQMKCKNVSDQMFAVPLAV